MGLVDGSGSRRGPPVWLLMAHEGHLCLSFALVLLLLGAPLPFFTSTVQRREQMRRNTRTEVPWERAILFEQPEPPIPSLPACGRCPGRPSNREALPGLGSVPSSHQEERPEDVQVQRSADASQTREKGAMTMCRGRGDKICVSKKRKLGIKKPRRRNDSQRISSSTLNSMGFNLTRRSLLMAALFSSSDLDFRYYSGYSG